MQKFPAENDTFKASLLVSGNSTAFNRVHNPRDNDKIISQDMNVNLEVDAFLLATMERLVNLFIAFQAPSIDEPTDPTSGVSEVGLTEIKKILPTSFYGNLSYRPLWFRYSLHCLHRPITASSRILFLRSI